MTIYLDPSISFDKSKKKNSISSTNSSISYFISLGKTFMNIKYINIPVKPKKHHKVYSVFQNNRY